MNINFDFIPEDKKKHLAVGLVSGLALGQRPVIAACVVIVLGAAKELYDYVCNKITKTNTHDVDVYDVSATWAGGAIGIAVVALLGHLMNVYV